MEFGSLSPIEESIELTNYRSIPFTLNTSGTTRIPITHTESNCNALYNAFTLMIKYKGTGIIEAGFRLSDFFERIRVVQSAPLFTLSQPICIPMGAGICQQSIAAMSTEPEDWKMVVSDEPCYRRPVMMSTLPECRRPVMMSTMPELRRPLTPSFEDDYSSDDTSDCMESLNGSTDIYSSLLGGGSPMTTGSHTQIPYEPKSYTQPPYEPKSYVPSASVSKPSRFNETVLLDMPAEFLDLYSEYAYRGKPQSHFSIPVLGISRAGNVSVPILELVWKPLKVSNNKHSNQSTSSHERLGDLVINSMLEETHQSIETYVRSRLTCELFMKETTRYIDTGHRVMESHMVPTIPWVRTETLIFDGAVSQKLTLTEPIDKPRLRRLLIVTELADPAKLNAVKANSTTKISRDPTFAITQRNAEVLDVDFQLGPNCYIVDVASYIKIINGLARMEPQGYAFIAPGETCGAATSREYNRRLQFYKDTHKGLTTLDPTPDIERVVEIDITFETNCTAHGKLKVYMIDF